MQLYKTNIFISTRNLISHLVLENENQFKSFNQEAQILNANTCYACKKKFDKNGINKEFIVVFICKHIFHKNCTIKEISEYSTVLVCPICKSSEVRQVSNSKTDSLVKYQSVIIEDKNKEFQVNVSVKDQNIIKKLKKFDRKLKNTKKIEINNILSV